MEDNKNNRDVNNSKQNDGDDALDPILYPPSEDIYNQFKKESDINPEDITKNKVPVEINSAGEFNEKDFDSDMSGSDLDVPGSELDDAQEKIGSEDEENNYYSIGGDNHNDLEENTSEDDLN